MGYPVGNQLNKKLLNCHTCNLYFHSDGTLQEVSQGYKTNYDWYFDFCKDAIHYYNQNIKAFDYEEFYDYYKFDAKNDINLRNLFDTKQYDGGCADFSQYLYQIDNLYNQLVAFHLKDSTGKSWYDDEAFSLKPTFNGYTGFLNCIEALLKEYIINVHTLNHDLFFERLNHTEWINGEMCDGFEELGSPFYGELQQDNRTYKCRLSKYTGKYKKKIRLYKLHGSKDYYVYYTNKHRGATLYPETYIKTLWGIRDTDFYKEIRKKKKILEYENCSINYHPDFLTGTTSKISRYQEPLLYKKLFELFKKNLNKAEILIIIGYGCKDSEINRYIIDEFGKKKPCFIIDPCAKTGDKVYDFISLMGKNTTLISKQIENLLLSDIGN
jgi:hypothetical protein